jgi:TonB family protein
MPDVSQKALNTIRGSVRLAVTIQVDASGKVSSSELSSPSGSSYFNEAALKAAARWQFQPGAGSRYIVHFQFTTRGAQATLSHGP